MATIKVACPECGQRVSGDETFYGKTVDCPICKAVIRFPEEADAEPVAPEKPKADAEKAKVDRAAESKEKPPSGEITEPTKARAPKMHRASAPVMPVTGPPARQPRAAEPRAPERTSSAAIWSLIFGVAALVLCPVGLLFAIPAIVAGHIGRGNIEVSMGRLGGYGLATGGLMLGYIYIILAFLLVVAVPWKPFATYGLQRYNEQAALTVVGALRGYAEENEGEFPPQLEALVPDFLSEQQFDASKWVDPETIPMIVRSPFVYHPGHSASDDAATILLSAPNADSTFRRMVCRLNGAVEMISEEDFLLIRE